MYNCLVMKKDFFKLLFFILVCVGVVGLFILYAKSFSLTEWFMIFIVAGIFGLIASDV